MQALLLSALAASAQSALTCADRAGKTNLMALTGAQAGKFCYQLDSSGGDTLTAGP